MISRTEKERKLIIVTAGRDGGKTTMLWELHNKLCAEGARPGGFITKAKEAVSPGDIVLIDLESGSESLLATEAERSDGEEWFRAGQRFSFSQESFDRANELYSGHGRYSHLFIDEAGPLEMKGMGFAPALKELQLSYEGTLIVAIRESLLVEFLSLYDFRIKREVEIIRPESSRPQAHY